MDASTCRLGCTNKDTGDTTPAASSHEPRTVTSHELLVTNRLVTNHALLSKENTAAHTQHHAQDAWCVARKARKSRAWTI